MRVIGPLVISAVVMGVSGVVHGIWTDRWEPSTQLEQAASRLGRVPATVGDWRGVDTPAQPGDMARAGIREYVVRTYQNPRTRESVSIMLVCGRGGPISVHTPDVCYLGAGYRQLTEAEHKQVALGPTGKAAFWVARFGKPGLGLGQLEIYWSWSPDGRTWEAPEKPRFSFARLPAVYKLYVVRDVPVGSKAEATNPCENFLQRALPEFGAALAPTE